MLFIRHGCNDGANFEGVFGCNDGVSIRESESESGNDGWLS